MSLMLLKASDIITTFSGMKKLSCMGCISLLQATKLINEGVCAGKGGYTALLGGLI